MIKKTLILLLLLSVQINFGQIQEYGMSLGGSNYIGEIGPTGLIRPNAPAVGFVYKYNVNERMAYRGTFTYMGISAKDANSNNLIRQANDLTLKKSLFEFTGGIDFNFTEFRFDHWRRGNTPYLIAELAFFTHKTFEVDNNGNVIDKIGLGTAIPIGFGYKHQLNEKFILAAEVRVRYTFTDNLDDGKGYQEFLNGAAVVNPNIEPQKFNDPNNDWYVFTGFTLTYYMGRPAYYGKRRRRR